MTDLGLLIIALACVSLSVSAQKGYKRPDSYNYNRGLEELQNENYGEALTYFNKEVEAEPKCGYAYFGIALIKLYYEEYGRALTSLDLALKYLPKKDDEYVCSAYVFRGVVYLALEDTVKALDDYAGSMSFRVGNGSRRLH